MRIKIVTVITLGIIFIALLANESLSNEIFSAKEKASTKSTFRDSIYEKRVEHQDLNLMRLYLSQPLYLRNVSNQKSAVFLTAGENTLSNDVLQTQANDKSAQESPVVATDPFGKPITEADVKSYMKSTYRYIMTSLYGTLSSLVGFSVIEENRYYKIVSTLTGASLGSISGYLMGKYGDKRLAVHKVQKARWEEALVNMTYDAISENIDREEATKAYQQFRRGEFTKGAIIGGVSGGGLGALGTILFARSFKGVAIGVLVTGVILAPGGVIAGYVIEQEVDRDEAMKELNKLLDRKRDSSSLDFERDRIALKMSTQGITNDKLSNHRIETDYIFRLVELKF